MTKSWLLAALVTVGFSVEVRGDWPAFRGPGHQGRHGRAAQQVEHHAARPLRRGGLLEPEPLGPGHQRPPEHHVDRDDQDDLDPDGDAHLAQAALRDGRGHVTNGKR